MPTRQWVCQNRLGGLTIFSSTTSGAKSSGERSGTCGVPGSIWTTCGLTAHCAAEDKRRDWLGRRKRRRVSWHLQFPGAAPVREARLSCLWRRERSSKGTHSLLDDEAPSWGTLTAERRLFATPEPLGDNPPRNQTDATRQSQGKLQISEGCRRTVFRGRVGRLRIRNCPCQL